MIHTRDRSRFFAEPQTLPPAQWPPALADLRDGDRPARLFVAGALPSLRGAVAIVGTRFSDEDASSFTRELSSALALAGRTVVSGGAEGIDAAAHAGALQVGGRTVAVLATGFARAYPAHHLDMFRDIARTGALLAEDAAAERVRAWSFLRRNRLIAALAECVVVVQAPGRSGALSTARWAQALGRTVYAVPAAPWDPRGEGCRGLLRSGARVCTSATDILSVPPVEGVAVAGSTPASARKSNDDHGLSDPARTLWELLRTGPRCPDELSVCLDMPPPRVQEGLLALLLAGWVRRRADGGYEKARSP